MEGKRRDEEDKQDSLVVEENRMVKFPLVLLPLISFPCISSPYQTHLLTSHREDRLERPTASPAARFLLLRRS